MLLVQMGVAVSPRASAELGYPLTIGTVKGDNLNVRGRPSFAGKPIGKLQKGDKVDIYEIIFRSNVQPGEPKKWIQVQLPDSIPVWVSEQYIDRASSTVMATSLNMRGGPGEEFGVLGRLPAGTAVEPILVQNGWVQIKTPSYATGYVAADFVEYVVNRNVAGGAGISNPVTSVSDVVTTSPSTLVSSPIVSSPTVPETVQPGAVAETTIVDTNFQTSLFESLDTTSLANTATGTGLTVESSSDKVVFDLNTTSTDVASTETVISSPVASSGRTTSNVTSGSSTYSSSSTSNSGLASSIWPSEEARQNFISESPVISPPPVSISSLGSFESTPVVLDPPPVYIEGSGSTMGETILSEVYVDEGASGSLESYTDTTTYGAPISDSGASTSASINYGDEVLEPMDFQSGSVVASSPAVVAAPAPTRIARPQFSPGNLNEARRVIREGVIKGTLNARAPTTHSLVNLETRRVINFLWAPQYQRGLKQILGQRVIIQGREILDSRWPKTPILVIDKIRVFPQN